MNSLNINLFIYISDLELSQYVILNILNKYKNDFLKNKIFPGLTELTELSKLLNKIVRKRSLLLDQFTIPIKKIDTDNKLLFFENFYMNNDDVERIFELMKWAIPKINSTIEEGLNIKKIEPSEANHILKNNPA